MYRLLTLGGQGLKIQADYCSFVIHEGIGYRPCGIWWEPDRKRQMRPF